MTRGHQSALPPTGTRNDPNAKLPGPLAARLTLEDSPEYIFDLSNAAGPEQIRAQLLAAVMAWSSNVDGGRRTASIGNMRRSVSSFLRWLDERNSQLDERAWAPVRSMEEFTSFHLRQFRVDLQNKYQPGTAYEYYSKLAILIKRAPGIREDTLWEAARRKGGLPSQPKPVQRYSPSEFSRLRSAARRSVQASHARISNAYALAHSHNEMTCPAPVRALALHEVLLFGKPQSKAGMKALGAGYSSVARGGGTRSARRHLFLSADEALAAAVLLVCHGGLNLSPVATANRPFEHEPGVMQLDLDKPRRGASSRFWAEVLASPNSEGVGEREQADSLLRLIAEATDPARDYLAANGAYTERLLIHWNGNQGEPKVGVPSWETRAGSAWIPSGITLSFPRLRRSVPNRGVSREPTNHSTDTYLYYLRSDPESLAEQREEAARGVQKLVDHARESLGIRLRSDAEANPNEDALLVNCSDPRNKPNTGLPCTTGFYSFLDCLECPNAVTVPRLLPRQMAVIQILEELRDSLGEVWDRRFASSYFKLMALVSRVTPAERAIASRQIEGHLPSVISALRHEVTP